MSAPRLIQELLESHSEAIVICADPGEDGQVKLLAFAKMDEEDSILASYLAELTEKLLGGQGHHREAMLNS